MNRILMSGLELWLPIRDISGFFCMHYLNVVSYTASNCDVFKMFNDFSFFRTLTIIILCAIHCF